MHTFYIAILRTSKFLINKEKLVPLNRNTVTKKRHDSLDTIQELCPVLCLNFWSVLCS